MSERRGKEEGEGDALTATVAAMAECREKQAAAMAAGRG